jgi:hypothetical protein
VNFEHELLMNRPVVFRKNARRSHAPFLRLLTIMVFVGLAVPLLAGGVYLGLGRVAAFFSSDGRAAAETSRVLIDSLKVNSAEAFLALCAESDAGTKLMRGQDAEEGIKNANAATDAQALTERRRDFEFLRVTLEQAGVVWADIKPWHYAGFRTDVKPGDERSKPARIALGGAYFASGGKLFRVSFAARRCDSIYVITDILGCALVDAKPDGVRRLAESECQAFEKEKPGAEDEKMEVRGEKIIFVRL